VLGVLLVIAAWWALVAVWYVVFGLLLVPYRLLRRGARKRTKEALQHRQMPAAIEATDRTTLEASAATPASEPPVAQRELAPVTVDVGLAAATASEDAAVPLPDDTPPALARLH
jgi:hypothetical protein